MIDDIGLYLKTIKWHGLLRAGIAKLQGKRNLMEVRIANIQKPFFIRVPSTDVPTLKKVFIDKEYTLPSGIAPDTIIDAGANIGLASIFFANRFPLARILAIEPEVSNFQILKKNVEPYPNIVPIQAALWHQQEQIQLTDPGIGHWGFRTESRSETGSGQTSNLVQAVTVGGILEEYGFSRIGILKVDIEGAEKEVFSNSASWIDLVDMVIIELHDRIKFGCESAFYSAVEGMDDQWKIGENVYVRRNNSKASNPE